MKTSQRAEIDEKLRGVGIASAPEIHEIGPSLEDVFVSARATKHARDVKQQRERQRLTMKRASLSAVSAPSCSRNSSSSGAIR